MTLGRSWEPSVSPTMAAVCVEEMSTSTRIRTTAGAAGMACGFEHAGALCVDGVCVMGACEVGWYDLDGTSENGCEYACTLQGVGDLPDPGYTDENCDGIDGDISSAVFVSKSTVGFDGGDGTMASPFGSIHEGIAAASSVDVPAMVLVAAGVYVEEITLAEGVGVAGGYDSGDWSRDTLGSETVIFGQALNPAGAIRALTAKDIHVPTLVTGLTIRSRQQSLRGWTCPGGVVEVLRRGSTAPGQSHRAWRWRHGNGRSSRVRMAAMASTVTRVSPEALRTSGRLR